MAPVFQIVSDLHLETRAGYDFRLPQAAPNLALLGDIGQVADDGLFVFLKKQLQRYWNVFFLLGNHEPAHTSWPAAKARVRQFSERMERLRARSTIGRFVFLDQTRHDMDGTTTILGCTLFSSVAEAQEAAVASRLVDFRNIRDWTVADHNAAHADDVQWLNAQVASIEEKEPDRNIFIFTHHCPTVDERTIAPQNRNSPVSSGFATDLRRQPCWENSSVVLWAFGHTHFNCDYVDGMTKKRVVANQVGYALAAEGDFDSKKLFMLEMPALS
ncbi:hypothetical protein SCUCBS95973_008815 [Sporothrix curviconia]|uniref:Calcineurin-like phosphoesterase domain-containing protein n=1 Tax=Sporothrix curviconia TaxID=1260050 RepID=A0ABP0CPN3_9PEZI